LSWGITVRESEMERETEIKIVIRLFYNYKLRAESRAGGKKVY
jgi:hypothetical protein